MNTHNTTGELGLELVKIMEDLTWERHGQIGVENAKRNLPFIIGGQSISALRNLKVGDGDSAVVIAAGPSIKRHDPIATIKAANYQGAIIATESSLSYCLRNGIIPDLTITLDPHATRIVRWFGDPSLTKKSLKEDDYFSRQDMDSAFADEMQANREILDLLNRHGHKIKIALCTSASEAVVNRVLETNMDIYWWNAMWDDPDQDGSTTEKIQRSNGVPSVNAGGNVGAAAWMMADAVLDKKHVALTGMDYSYYDGTPYRNTQYYHESVNLIGEENLDSLYIRIHNPHLDSWFFTDPTYMWYQECFKQMVLEADCQTYNCTNGGILFGDGIKFIPLEDFLNHEEVH